MQCLTFAVDHCPIQILVVKPSRSIVWACLKITPPEMRTLTIYVSFGCIPTEGGTSRHYPDLDIYIPGRLSTKFVMGNCQPEMQSPGGIRGEMQK
jgi:hypothetical protein